MTNVLGPRESEEEISKGKERLAGEAKAIALADRRDAEEKWGKWSLRRQVNL
jgi:hypothetical protein